MTDPSGSGAGPDGGGSASGLWHNEGNALVRTVSGADFAWALRFVNAVGAVAEALGHHPDIDIRWNVVTVRLVSHDVGAVTARDWALAAAIDAIDLEADGSS